MKKILITRPKEQAKELAEVLGNSGFEVFVEPLFDIERLKIKKNFEKISAVIITSLNACFALNEAEIGKDVKIFTVGKKTAQKLQEIGFKNLVISSKNSAESLVSLVKKESGQILYFHGSVISFDFAKNCKNVKNILAYKTHEIADFSTDFLNFVKENSFDEVAIFSQNSAKIFARLAKKHNLLEYFSSSQILCLSKNILASVKQMGFKNSAIFSKNLILKNFYE